jgi:CBS domain-containing protein
LTGLTLEQRRGRQARVRVEEVMSTEVWTVRPELRAAIAGRRILDNRIGCLPVIDDERRLVGIVTERDFMRRAIEALEVELVARAAT